MQEVAIRQSIIRIHIEDGVQWIRGDLADLSIKDDFRHIHDYVGLGSLACAGRVGLNQANKCLPDTRTNERHRHCWFHKK